MAYPHYRSQFGDTTYTKVFVGGLAWETPTHQMRRYFEQFGEILEAVVITDKNTNKSKGYGFVTFRDPESARRACADPNPVIDGRRANCNIASLGRPRPSPPRGRNHGANPYQATGGGPLAPPSLTLPPPLPPPPPPIIYPHYGYPTYPPDYGYQQALYNPQYYHQPYGAAAPSSSSPSSMASPYFYGYSLQSPRGTFSGPASPVQRVPGPSYVYYPTQMQMQMQEGSFSPYPPPVPSSSTRHNPNYHSSSTDLQTPQQSSTETEVPESPKPKDTNLSKCT